MKSNWRSNHVSHCLVGIAVTVGLLLAFGVQIGTLVYLAAAVACPLMMVIMMRGMMGPTGHATTDQSSHQELGRRQDSASST